MLHFAEAVKRMSRNLYSLIVLGMCDLVFMPFIPKNCAHDVQKCRQCLHETYAHVSQI